MKLLRLRKKDTLQRIICPFWYRPDLFDKLDETPCFSHLLPMNIQLPFISHSLFKLFFTSKRLGVGGSAADGMAAAAHVRTTRQSLKVLYRGCKEVVRKHVQQLIAVNIRFLDTYKHHQDATCQHPDKKKASCSILFQGLFERKTTSFSLFAGPLDLPFRMWSSSSLRPMTTKKGWVTPCWCIRNQFKFSTLAADSKSQLYIPKEDQRMT